MKFNQQQQETFQKAAFLCSRAEKCSNKVKLKLLDWGLNEEEAGQVIDKLIQEKYLDDERYARIFVRDKFRFNKWGRIKISYQLRVDKINNSIIDVALGEIDDEDYKATLTKLLQEKSQKTKAVNQYDKKSKLFRFAQSRGFESDLILSVLGKNIKT